MCLELEHHRGESDEGDDYRMRVQKEAGGREGRGNGHTQRLLICYSQVLLSLAPVGDLFN